MFNSLVTGLSGMRTRSRVVVTLCVVVVIFGTGVHYAQASDEQWPYPTPDALATDYDAHVGEPVFLIGRVVSVAPESESLELVVDTNRVPLRLTATDVSVSVASGGVVQVFGTSAPNRSIVVDRAVVVNDSGSAALYKYGVSIVGAGLVLALFFRHWQVGTRPLGLEARDG